MSDPPEPRRWIDDPDVPESVRGLLESAAYDDAGANAIASVAAKLAASNIPVVALPSSLWLTLVSVFGGVGLIITIGIFLYASPETPDAAGLEADPTSGAPEAEIVEPPARDPRDEWSLVLEPVSAPVEPPSAPERNTSRERATSERRARETIDPLSRESFLLAGARSSLTQDPRSTLRWSNTHQREFGADGVLSEERDALRIRALLALGDTARARVFIDEFHRTYPASIHRFASDVIEPPPPVHGSSEALQGR